MPPLNVTILSELPTDDPGFNIADQRALHALSEAEVHHFWFRHRNEFISKRLIDLGYRPPAKVLELGCGGGTVCAHLANLGFEVTGVDGHRPRVLEAARRVPRGAFFVHDFSKGAGPFRNGDFDAVGLFDVIEHLHQPGEALIQALSCARVGGVVVGTVPALMSLWSEVDAHSGHRLRFEQSSLAELLDSVPGASVIEIRPFNRALVPLLFLQRRLFRQRPGAIESGAHLKVPPASLNRIFGSLLRLEQLIGSALDRLRLPGASLWFALRKDSPKSARMPSGPS